MKKVLVASTVALTLLASPLLTDASSQKTEETIALQDGTVFHAQQGSKQGTDMNRVYVYENGTVIFRTNGDGDNGTFKDLFVAAGSPFIVVNHYKKGEMILRDADPLRPISAEHINRVVIEDGDSVIYSKDGNWRARNNETGRVFIERKTAIMNDYSENNNGWSTVTRSNGYTDGNGELVAFYMENGLPHVLVKRSDKANGTHLQLWSKANANEAVVKGSKNFLSDENGDVLDTCIK